MPATTDLLQNIAGNLGEIVRSELQLARAEIREEALKAARAGAMVGAGSVAALFGLGFFLWCIAFALTAVMPVWSAALVVALILLAAGGVLLAVGLSRLRRVHPKPRQAVRQMKEDVEWIKHRT